MRTDNTCLQCNAKLPKDAPGDLCPALFALQEPGQSRRAGREKTAQRQPVFGTPDISLVSTSYVERSNITIRMTNRRYTRLTNPFSKKLENHAHMCALTFMAYNYCWKHSTLKTSPAVAAGVVAVSGRWKT